MALPRQKKETSVMDNDRKPAMTRITPTTRKALEAKARSDSKWAQRSVNRLLGSAFKDAAWTWDLIRELGLV
jgi:hypothetical protein